MDLQGYFNQLFSYRTLGSVCFLGGISALVVGWYMSIPLAITFGVALVGAATVSQVAQPPTSTFVVHYINRKTKILVSFYFTLIALLIMFFYIEGYRSKPVLGTTLLLYLISIIIIFYSNSRLGLLLFVLSTVFHRGTIFFSSAVLYGSDPLFHARIARQTREVAGIAPSDEAGKYTITPIYHILMSIISKITEVPVYPSSFVISILYVLVSSFIIYVLCSRWIGEDTAVFAVILFVVAEEPIRWSVQSQATSLGLVFFAIGIFVFLQWIENDDWGYEAMFILIATALVLTHQVSVFILLVAATVVLLIHALVSQGNITFRVTQPLLSLYFMVGIVWSILEYQTVGGNHSFIERLALNIGYRIQFGNLDREIIRLPSEIDVVITGFSNRPLLHTSGFGILLFLGVLGGLLLHRWDRNPQQTVFLLPTIAIMYIIAFGTGIVATILQPTRWFQFTYLFLAILGGFGITATVSTISTKYSRVIVISLILIYLLLMGGAVSAGLDGIVHQETKHTQEQRVTDSEYQMLQFAHDKSHEITITGDFHSQTVLERHFGSGWIDGEASTFAWSLEELVTAEGPQLFIERPILYSGHANFMYVTEKGIQRVSGYPPTNIEDCGRHIVYTVGGDSAESSHLRYTDEQCGTLPQFNSGQQR